MCVVDMVAQHTRHVYISSRRGVHVCLFLFDLEVSRLVRTVLFVFFSTSGVQCGSDVALG